MFLNLLFILLFVVVVLFVKFTDPGYLPQKLLCNFEEFFVENPKTRQLRLVFLGVEQESKYESCPYCKIQKHVSTKHCFRCNCCVRQFDHHSSIFGCCIGKRNFKYMIMAYLILVTQNVHLILLMF